MVDVLRVVWIGLSVVLVLVGVGLIAASVQTSDGGSQRGATYSFVDPAGNVAPLHDAGVTGENVTVGVVDVTGFDTDARALDGRVVASRSFEPGESIPNDVRTEHGTAAASVVARVAPDVDLYLATFDTVIGYRSALSWFERADVDVILAPVTFYGKPGDGSGAVSTTATSAVRNGTVVVTPAGNLARGHWTGEYDDVRDGNLRFGDGVRNYLAGGARPLTLWLSWEQGRDDEDYSAELYRTNGSETWFVARSRPYAGDDVPNERLVAQLDSGSYFVVVTGPEAATGARLKLESPTHRLQYRDVEGSVAAPATAPGVLAVGAYDAETGSVARFSSRGPTDDGRLGVDVVAPDRLRVAGRPGGFVGSSAAASYAAGVAALVRQQRPSASPREVERLIERSALDAGKPGIDVATGHGRIVPERAVAGTELRNGSRGFHD